MKGQQQHPADWAVKMNWHDLLFCHWPMACDDIRPLVPKGLRIDKYDGRAWVGVIPFHMTGIRMRHLPPVPTTHAFNELNVRTYVRDGDRVGVWFLTLDASSHLAVAFARRWHHLNYLYADMETKKEAGEIDYTCRRRGSRAAFHGHCRPIGEPLRVAPGSLEYFLTERYSFWAEDPRGQLWRTDVEHKPWELRHADTEVEHNTMLEPLGLKLPTVQPHMVYAQGTHAVAMPPVLLPAKVA
jgi:uncharacterized protein YqjF (DUF2071 family)